MRLQKLLFGDGERSLQLIYGTQPGDHIKAYQKVNQKVEPQERKQHLEGEI